MSTTRGQSIEDILTDAERYKFLRDSFALASPDDEAAFKQLARFTGDEFDAAIDAAMAHDREMA
jgi:hypothetical protein